METPIKRKNISDAGRETETVTHSGVDELEHGLKTETGTKAQVYVEVSDTDVSVENSGSDRTIYGHVETRAKNGNPDYLTRMRVITSDIYDEFTNLFEKFFMEAL